MDDKRKQFSDSQKESIDSNYSSGDKSSSSSGTEGTAPETSDDRELAAVLETMRQRAQVLGPISPTNRPEHYSHLFMDRVFNFFIPAMREFTFNCKGSQSTVNVLQVVCDRLRHLCRNGIWRVEFDEVYAEVERARAIFIGAISEPENRLLESLLSLWYHCYVRIRGSLRYTRLYQMRLFSDEAESGPASECTTATESGPESESTPAAEPGPAAESIPTAEPYPASGSYPSAECGSAAQSGSSAESILTAEPEVETEPPVDFLESREPIRNLCWQLNKELVHRLVKQTVDAVELVFEWFRPTDPFQSPMVLEQMCPGDDSEVEELETESETISAVSN